MPQGQYTSADLAGPSAPVGKYSLADVAEDQNPPSLFDKAGGVVSRTANAVAAGVGPMLKQVADVSAPKIAYELYKHYTGQPNELKAIPKKALEFFGQTLAGAIAVEPAAVEAQAAKVQPKVAPAEIPATKPVQPSTFPPAEPRTNMIAEPGKNVGVINKPGLDLRGVTKDSMEDKVIQDAMNADLERHGMMTRSEESRRAWAANTPGTPKSILTGQADKPVKFTPMKMMGQYTVDDLTPVLQESLKRALKARVSP